MATVVKIITIDNNNRHFESHLVDGTWHAIISYGDAIRTVCGVQLEGDDGYGPGPEKQGAVTCQGCRAIIGEIQKIKGWK